jgi:multidrug efflux pump subunit AcrA (membrane-fusion protein)
MAIAVIFALMVLAYLLTFLIPGGSYARIEDAGGNLLIDTAAEFTYVQGGIPFWKWLLSPVLILGAAGSGTLIAVIVFLLMFFPVRNTVNTEFVLKSPNTNSVYAWFDGPIAKCYRQDGDQVQKGEVIAEYDTNQLRFRLANAESQLREIQKEYELESAAAFSDRERLGRAQLVAARMDGAKVAVEEAKWYLAHTELKAPSDGILALADGRAERLVNKALRTGDRVFDIYSGSGAVAEIQVDQRESSILLDEFTVSLFLYTEPDRKLDGKVFEVQQYPMLNEQRTYCYKVRAEISDAESLRYGMRGVAKLHGKRVSLGYYLFKNIVIYLRWL